MYLVPKQYPASHTNQEILALRQCIIGSRHTSHLGRQERPSVSIPFSKETFDTYFQTIRVDDIPVGDSRNVRGYLSGPQMTQAIGKG